MLWLYKSPHRSRDILTYSLQSVNCLSTEQVQKYFFQKRRVYNVEHYPPSCPCLTLQNEFRNAFPDSSVSPMVNRFRDTRKVQGRNRSGRPLELFGDNLKDIHQNLLAHHESHWENFIFGVDYPMEVHKTSMRNEWVAWLFDLPVHIQMVR